jgi:hypothetical protein
MFVNELSYFKDIIKHRTVKEIAGILFKVMEPEMRALVREEIQSMQKVPASNLPGSIVK